MPMGWEGNRGNGTLFVNRKIVKCFVVIAIFLSVLSNAPRHCARLTNFLHPKLREITAVLNTPKRMTRTLRRAVSAPNGGGGVHRGVGGLLLWMMLDAGPL